MTTPLTPLRALILEDNPFDAELVSRELLRIEPGADVRLVRDEIAYLAALREWAPDLVLADFRLPGFNALAALALARRELGDVPFIIVTGSLDEETAADCIKSGADDYVLKERMARLSVAVPAAIERVRTRAEAHRTADEARLLRRVVEQTPVSVVVTDVDGNIEYVNPYFSAVTGYSRDEVTGLNPRVLKSTHQPAEFYRELWQTITAGRQWRGEMLNRRKNGELYWEDVVISPLVDAAGAVTQYVGFKTDITELKRQADALAVSQAHMQRSQKLEAIGRLAGGIAHDFNNILAVILGYGEFLQSELGAGSALLGDVKEVLAAANRAAALTRQLLAFSRRQPLRAEVVDLAGVVADLSTMLRRLIGEDVALTVATPDEPALVLVDRSHVEQVVMNLAVNARDAMPGGGTLTILIDIERLDAPGERHGLTLPPGEYVRLTVEDSGVGMSPDVAARVFEPFFTTKEQGSGLGLATVYGIVTQSNGHIVLDSTEGRGTAFVVWLPRTAPQAGRADSTGVVAAPQVRTGDTVLLVEDNEALRELTHKVLVRSGYSVIATETGETALDLLRRSHARVDLLLTDVVLPGISGQELAAGAGLLRPELKVLLTSGYPAGSTGRPITLPDAVAFLAKPYTSAELLARIASLLDR